MALAHRLSLSVFAAALLQTAAFAQWSPAAGSNLAIAAFNGDQAVPLVAANGDGSSWVAWFDKRGGSYAVYAQRLDAQGKEQLLHGGVLVSNHPQSSTLSGWDMMSDGTGGCVIAFTDRRNGPDLDVYAYQLDALGTPLWGANGLTLSDNSDAEANPVLTLADDGHFICAWARTSPSAPGSIRVQRIRPNGGLDYPADCIAIKGSGRETPNFPEIVAADYGGYIVSYIRDSSATSGIRHLRAQKFEYSGAPLWTAGPGVSVYDANSLPLAHRHQLRSDEAGGAVFAWHRSITGFEVMTQRVDAAGTETFPHNGIVICADTTIELNPALSVEPQSGDAFIFFNKENAGQTQYSLSVQRISTAGALLFGANAIDLIPLDAVVKSNLRSVPYADGAAGCCFRATGPATHDLISFRVDGNGNSVWGAPVVTSSVVSGKQRVALDSDATGLLRMVWSDDRTAPSANDVYAQNVNVDGTLGGVTTPSTNFCLGDGSVTACPCGNNATMPGHGCASASFPGGALLRPTGPAGASGISDGLRLIATDIPGPGLFFQANGVSTLPIALGDGLLCATIGVIRLGVVFPVANVAIYPGGVTALPIHFAGAPISPGDVKYYQCWYRSLPPLCTATSNFGLTQGVMVIWGL